MRRGSFLPVVARNWDELQFYFFFIGYDVTKYSMAH